MTRKHPVFLWTEQPPCGGEPVLSLEQLEDKPKIFRFIEEKVEYLSPKKRYKNFRIKVIEPQVPVVKEDWKLKQIIVEYCPLGWERLFGTCFGEFEFIQPYLDADQYCYPTTKNIFRAFELCTPYDLKVVFIDTSPYHYSDKDSQEPLAEGLALSMNSKIKRFSPEISAIYKELQKTVPGFVRPVHGNLTSWARQGVLLLNTRLTVRRGDKDSHQNIWNGFLDRTIRFIKEHCPKCVFVLFGREARSLAEDRIGDKYCIIESSRPNIKYGTFINSDIFNRVNSALQSTGQKQIDWTVR